MASKQNHAINKREAKRIMSAIRRVLLDVWDPIGIRNEPNAQDEYDSYIGGAFHLLATSATDEQIAGWLWRQAEETMGLSGARKEDMYPTVAALRQIKVPRDPA